MAWGGGGGGRLEEVRSGCFLFPFSLPHVSVCGGGGEGEWSFQTSSVRGSPRTPPITGKHSDRALQSGF